MDVSFIMYYHNIAISTVVNFFVSLNFSLFCFSNSNSLLFLSFLDKVTHHKIHNLYVWGANFYFWSRKTIVNKSTSCSHVIHN